MSQVYISGFGLVSCLGPDLNAALQHLHPTEPQVRKIKELDDVVPYFPIMSTADSDNWYQRCEHLVNRAVVDVGITNKSGGLYFASSSCHVGALEKNQRNNSNIVEFLTEVKQMLDWKGSVHWVNTACTSSLNAILLAKEAINSGLIKDALVLGFELENQLTLSGFAGMQLLSFQKPMPFSAKRDGLVLGEAVAVLYLTDNPNRWRIAGGAHIIDSSQSGGASSSAYQTMLQHTLAKSQFNPKQIDMIKVHAAGSRQNDAVEAESLCNFFTSGKSVPALLSFKSLLGHTLGASGAAEIALLLALVEQKKWLNLALDDAVLDATLGVNFAPQPPPVIKRLLTCNLGFGGSHCCIALEDMNPNNVN